MRDFPAGLIECLENCIESHFPRNFGDSSSQLNERRQGSSTDIDDLGRRVRPIQLRIVIKPESIGTMYVKWVSNMHGGPLPAPWIITYRSDSIVPTTHGTRNTMLPVLYHNADSDHLLSRTFPSPPFYEILACKIYVSLIKLLQNTLSSSMLLLLRL